MTYDEALQALKEAQGHLWMFEEQTARDRLTQAIEVFKRMKVDLDQCEADIKGYETCISSWPLWNGGKTDEKP